MAVALGLGRLTNKEDLPGKLADVANLVDLNTPKTTTLTTAGAGTLVAAALVGGVIVRTGTQSGAAFSDTTDTAALIIAALTNPPTNTSWEVIYQNKTDAVATILAGSGVTLSGVVIIPPQMSARFIMTLTSQTAVSMVSLAGTNPATPVVVSTPIATTPVTLTAAQFINGILNVTVANSTTALTTPTAAAIVAAIPGCQVGSSFIVTLMNLGSGTLTWTLGTGVTGLTTNDVTTVATNKGMSYRCGVSNIGSGTEAVKIAQLSFAAT